MTFDEALRILFPDLLPLPHDEHCACFLCTSARCPCCWQDVEWAIAILCEDPARTPEQVSEIMVKRHYPNAVPSQR